MDSNILSRARWGDYVLACGSSVTSFWRTHLEDSQRRVLFVLGKGFDPRMCLGLECLLDAGGNGKCDILAIVFNEGETSPSQAYQPSVAANWDKLSQMLKSRGSIKTHRLTMLSDDCRRIGSRNAANIFNSVDELNGYSDVVVDTSALPRSIYFPLIAKLLELLDEKRQEVSTPSSINLHVFVSENPSLDMNIQDEEVDEQADYMHGFRGNMDAEATAERPKVWIPLLGEGQKIQLDRIVKLVNPDETCPVLPSPSFNPRRGDELVLEYYSWLFDSLRVEPRNFIYAHERNPFEVYKQIRRTVLHYRQALEPLGGCKVALSALSSKLMSLGVLLVAYELKKADVEIGVAHVESHGYRMNAANGAEAQTELFSLWLAGECYEA